MIYGAIALVVMVTDKLPEGITAPLESAPVRFALVSVPDDRLASVRFWLEGCSHNMMLRGECGAAILVEVPPELFPAACSESQRTYRQYGESPIVLPTRARFA